MKINVTADSSVIFYTRVRTRHWILLYVLQSEAFYRNATNYCTSDTTYVFQDGKIVLQEIEHVKTPVNKQVTRLHIQNDSVFQILTELDTHTIFLAQQDSHGYEKP